jgi:acetyl esterase
MHTFPYPRNASLRIASALLVMTGIWATDLLPAPMRANIPYGPNPLQTMDYWRGNTAATLPLCVYFHGGGFTTGDKRDLSPLYLKALVDQGFAVVSVNYRLTTMPIPMQDGVRAIQFIRANAAAFKIKDTAIVSFGDSAGAMIALRLAYHNDLANPNSTDAVARRSSRLAAVGSVDGQTTFNPPQVQGWFGAPAIPLIGKFAQLFGLINVSQFELPAVQVQVQDCSAYSHITADDPPTFIQQNQDDVPVTDANVLHHPIWGQNLRSRLISVGVPVQYNNVPATGPAAMAAYFRAKINSQSSVVRIPNGNG